MVLAVCLSAHRTMSNGSVLLRGRVSQIVSSGARPQLHHPRLGASRLTAGDWQGTVDGLDGLRDTGPLQWAL